MGIRESLTLTWQDLDQSPLSLFTYCEEAMAMEKMQALYYHLQRFTQCLLNRGFRVLSSSTGSVYVVIYST